VLISDAVLFFGWDDNHKELTIESGFNEGSEQLCRIERNCRGVAHLNRREFGWLERNLGARFAIGMGSRKRIRETFSSLYDGTINAIVAHPNSDQWRTLFNLWDCQGAGKPYRFYASLISGLRI
jgi:hypothetical protein